MEPQFLRSRFMYPRKTPGSATRYMERTGRAGSWELIPIIIYLVTSDRALFALLTMR